MQKEITFKPNIEKAVEVILWFCAKKKGKINRYNLLKALFYAEIEHLNKYGRPIIGDTYIAMKYGTVPSLIDNLITKNAIAFSKERIRSLPYDLNKNDILAKREANNKFFSKSDIKCLENAFKKYGKLPFGKLRDVNHAHKAWKTTWKEHPNEAIPFELLIDDEVLREELREVSSNMVI